MQSYEIPRHKVFISFHSDDERYKELLVNRTEYNPNKGWQSIFDDYSVGGGEIDDNNTDETIRRIIRDDYIRGAKVLILLCGEETKNRKFIDWELHAAMFDTEHSPKLGILVINLPTISGEQEVSNGGDADEANAISPSCSWHTPTSRKEYEDELPYMPSRIVDNYEAIIRDDTITGISAVDWSRIENDSLVLKELIDDAYKRGADKRLHYNHSAPLRRNNS